jgi:hypothetical protein
MANSPSLLLRILADVTGLGKSMEEVSAKGAGAAGKLKDTFGGLLSTLNATGVLGPFGDALNGVVSGLDQINKHGKDAGLALLGIGGAMAGVGAGLSALGSKDQAAHQQLQASVQATGKDYEDYAKQVDDAIKKQEHFGHSASDTQDALRILTQATGDPAKALQYLGTASDLAAAKHESLSTAAGQLGKTYGGSTRLLKEFGGTAEKATDNTKQIEAATKTATAADQVAAQAKQHLADLEAIDSGKKKLSAQDAITLRDAEQKVTETAGKATDAHKKLADMHQQVIDKTQASGNNLDILSGKLKGQASAAADTFGGKLSALKAGFEDQAAQLGQKYGPALTGVGSILAGVGAAVELVTTLHDLSIIGWIGDAAAAAAAAVAENLALLGIPLLIAAVVAGIAWMVTHWDKVKEAVEAAWTWIKDHWPLLLAILLGPFGIAVDLIIRYWSQIKGAAKDAVDFITGLWNDFVKFVSGLPGKLAGYFTHMWDGIYDAFRAVINDVIGLWNKLHFTLPKIDLGPLGKIGGGDIGVPQIQPMATGGIVNRATLALIGESGPEAVIPLDGRHGMGPALQINNATFNSAVDVDMLSKRLEFAINAGVRV